MKRLFLFILVLACINAVAQSDSSWDMVPQILGRGGKLTDDIYKVGFPRTDLKVTINGTAIAPTAGLGTWMAFRKADSANYVADGDLVLLAAEVNPVISALQNG